MKQLTKALLLAIGFLPLVSFAKCEQPKVDDTQMQIDGCENEGLYLFHTIKNGKIDKYGYMDSNGKTVIPAQYTLAFPFNDGLASVVTKDGMAFLNSKGEIVVKPDVDSTIRFSEDLALVYKDGKYGYIDKQGKVVIPLQYASARDFSQGYAIVSLNSPLAENFNGSTQTGVIDKNNHIVIAMKYDMIDDYYDGKTGFLVTNWLHEPTRLSQEKGEGRAYAIGFVDMTGKEIIPLAEQNISFSYELGAGFVCKTDNQCHYFNAKGKMSSDTYEKAQGFFEGLAVIKRNGRFGYLDPTGKEVIAPIYDEADSFNNGTAIVKKNNGYSLIDKQGQKLTRNYDALSKYADDTSLYIAQKNQKFGIIDSRDKVILPFDYDKIGLYFGEPAKVRINGKWGFIDSQTHTVISPQYEETTGFNEGLAGVQKNGKWGFIDDNNQTIIPFIYDNPNIEFNGKDWYKYENLYEVVDNTMIAIKKNGKWGVIDKKGKVLVNFEYQAINLMSSTLPIEVTKNGKTYQIPNLLLAH